ncbi:MULTISPECIES: ABC transporter permease [Nguyenibacter]|uniref:ABC transporter permease n=1 Tax=Nguyenibacter vanlangensis TaxID=1216886 RepID=A0A7Y7M603_9PROT|nr:MULTISPECIES: ABC transporter permease [Nguyenibacter]NVN10389.1 ABC transporter permease [Nguyenibacter vanlangensis]WRH89595.1 ABC transporter permease [Nguyenibacter sp. L1]
MSSLINIFWLGIKELRSVGSDLVMIFFVAYSFTGAIYAQATGTSSEVNNASIAFTDEDGSALSGQLMDAFYPPRFQTPQAIAAADVETAMDEGRFMFVVVIPPRFEADLRAGRHPDVQLNIDATAMQQAAIGGGYIKNIIGDRISSFFRRSDASAQPAINLVIRRLFNPNGETSWFASVVAIINQITLLTIVLTGAAVIREREHGTLEHLLVMPLTAFEIAMAKVWANSLVILVATALSLYLIVMKALHVPFAGSISLWFLGVLLYLFFATALGLFLGTISRSMAQFALLIIFVNVMLQLLSGGSTPVESQPTWLQYMTFFLPSRHFVSFSQKIIYRGGGIDAVWRQFAMVGAIGLAFFVYSLALFRKSIAVTK